VFACDYEANPVYFAETFSVIFFTVVLKLITVFFSLCFQTFWLKWWNFFWLFQKRFGLWLKKKPETNWNAMLALWHHTSANFPYCADKLVLLSAKIVPPWCIVRELMLPRHFLYFIMLRCLLLHSVWESSWLSWSLTALCLCLTSKDCRCFRCCCWKKAAWMKNLGGVGG